MIVLDTSALVEYVVGSDSPAERVRARCTGQRLAAPHAVDLECASTLRGLVLGRKLPADEAKRGLGLLRRMNIRRFGHVTLLPRIWDLRDNMWPYDAAYAALAESLDAELVTMDGKFAAVPGLKCAVRNLAREQPDAP